MVSAAVVPHPFVIAGRGEDPATNNPPYFANPVDVAYVPEFALQSKTTLGFLANECQDELGSLVGEDTVGIPGQHGWDGGGDTGIVVNRFSFNNTDGTYGDEKITTRDAHTGLQSWRLSRHFTKSGQRV